MGLFLGEAVLGAVLVALLGGSLFGLALCARDGRAAAKQTIPFAPSWRSAPCSHCSLPIPQLQ